MRFLLIATILIISQNILSSNHDYDLMIKYNNYRDRLLNEFILISPHVEQFGTNLPAVDRKIDSSGNPIWLSWSDGNSNFNQWLGILATEYKLLKINNQDYQETLGMLLYTMIAIERLDLYAEYTLRKHHNKFLVYEGDTLFDYILLPNDINGFLLRDDVSLGFWRQYHSHFGIPYGWHIKTNDGTNTYRSVFQRGKIAKQGMSQDNIYYLLQALAIVKEMLAPECIKGIEIYFINQIIPEYLIGKQIISNDTVYFDKWVVDISDRLINHIIQEYPKPEIVLKPFKGNGRAQPSRNSLFALMSSRWYIMNPVTDSIVREGSGEDMGVWINSFGVAEVGNKLNPNTDYHYDNSQRGLNKYLFESLVFKSMRFLKFGGFPIPESIDDYMFRALATIADINRGDDSYALLHLMRDKRSRKTYEHNPLILILLHSNKYKAIYKQGISYYEEDKQFYEYLLSVAPAGGPTTDRRVNDYHPYWSSSSRLTWPANKGRVTKEIYDFAGMDYMYLYNLYKLVFSNHNYSLNENRRNELKLKSFQKYHTPIFIIDADYNYLPPKVIVTK